MNRTAAIAAIKALHGMTARHGFGEIRITFTVDEMMRREGIDRKAAIARCEDVAAYESDPESAVDTARAMLAVKPVAETVSAVGTIDLTPTWSGMLSTLRMLVENGNAEGRKTAWGELARMAALADQRNTFGETFGTLATVASETAHHVPAGTARDELDAAIAAAFTALNASVT